MTARPIHRFDDLVRAVRPTDSCVRRMFGGEGICSVTRPDVRRSVDGRPDLSQDQRQKRRISSPKAQALYYRMQEARHPSYYRARPALDDPEELAGGRASLAVAASPTARKKPRRAPRKSIYCRKRARAFREGRQAFAKSSVSPARCWPPAPCQLFFDGLAVPEQLAGQGSAAGPSRQALRQRQGFVHQICSSTHPVDQAPCQRLFRRQLFGQQRQFARPRQADQARQQPGRRRHRAPGPMRVEESRKKADRAATIRSPIRAKLMPTPDGRAVHGRDDRHVQVAQAAQHGMIETLQHVARRLLPAAGQLRQVGAGTEAAALAGQDQGAKAAGLDRVQRRFKPAASCGRDRALTVVGMVQGDDARSVPCAVRWTLVEICDARNGLEHCESRVEAYCRIGTKARSGGAGFQRRHAGIVLVDHQIAAILLGAIEAGIGAAHHRFRRLAAARTGPRRWRW